MDTRAKERSLPWPAQQITRMKSQSGGGYLRLRSRRPLFYASFIFYWHDWRYRFFCRWRLLSWRRWLLAQCPPCNFPARFRLFLFWAERLNRLAGVEMLRQFTEVASCAHASGAIAKATPAQRTAGVARWNAHQKISFPSPEGQITAAFSACGLNSVQKDQSFFLGCH